LRFSGLTSTLARGDSNTEDYLDRPGLVSFGSELFYGIDRICGDTNSNCTNQSFFANIPTSRFPSSLNLTRANIPPGADRVLFCDIDYAFLSYSILLLSSEPSAQNLTRNFSNSPYDENTMTSIWTPGQNIFFLWSNIPNEAMYIYRAPNVFRLEESPLGDLTVNLLSTRLLPSGTSEVRPQSKSLFGEGKFITTYSDFLHRVVISADSGQTWTDSRIPGFSDSEFSSYAYGIASDGFFFFNRSFMGISSYRSSDGKTWVRDYVRFSR
jgi:hypothetical protein